MNTETIRELYHAYYYDAQVNNLDPMSFEEWQISVFQPFLSGRELVLSAVN